MIPRRKRGGLPERPHRLPKAMDKKGPTRIRQSYGTLESAPGRKAIAEFDSTKDSSDRIIKRANQAEVDSKKKLKKYGNGGKVKKYKKGGFPDLTGDGKVTKADILKGRGVGERKKKRAIRKITRKALNSATSEKKRMDQADLERQNKVKGTKNLLNSLGKYGKGKK